MSVPQPVPGKLFWSAETFRIFGYDIKTKPTTRLVVERTHPEDRADVQHVIDQASLDQRDFEHRYRLLLPDGTVLKPHHMSTRSATRPVVPGEVTRYDIEIFPTAALIAARHRLRLTITTYDFPHLVPTKPARRALVGGRYQLQQGGPTPSHIVIPLADPDALT